LSRRETVGFSKTRFRGVWSL